MNYTQQDLVGSTVRIKGGTPRTAVVMDSRVVDPNTGEVRTDWVQVDRDLKRPDCNKWFRHWPIAKLEVVKMGHRLRLQELEQHEGATAQR